MGRILFVGGLACLALGLVALPANAGDDEGLAREVEKLRQEVHVMRASMLENEIDSYLSETEALHGAQGGDALQGVTIHANFTAVFQGTVGQSSPANDIGVASGDMDLQFDFQVTDNLNLFFNATANEQGMGALPYNYPATNIAGSPGFGGAISLGGLTGLSVGTAGGWTDGIGVNGTVPTAPGSIRLEEGGIRQLIPAGSTEIWNEMGKLDPRDRFLQSAFTDDENLGFINNNVDDNPAIPYLTNAAGTNSLGWHISVVFGNNKQYSVNFGWFAFPGQWFAQGQLMAQFSWKGEIAGREMNVRVAGFWQNLMRRVSAVPLVNETSSAGGGVVWDWLATDKMGIFVKIAVDGGDINPVDMDASVGLVWTGIIGSRPNDALGVAVSLLRINTTVTGPIPEDQEISVEVYYRYTMEDGKLQITPHVIYVGDPGGGTTATGGTFTDDSLFILGLRVHVPF